MQVVKKVFLAALAAALISCTADTVALGAAGSEPRRKGRDIEHVDKGKGQKKGHGGDAGAGADPAGETEPPTGEGEAAPPGEPSEEPAAPVFHVQLWDGHKTGWEDDKLADLAAAGFTVVQNGWGGSLFPSRALLERMTSHGLVYGAYINTPCMFGVYATEEEKAAVREAVDFDGIKPAGEYNVFDETYRGVIERCMREGFAGLEGTEGLYKIMINSERNAPISYDELTVEKAAAAGAMEATERIPAYTRSVWRLRDENQDGLADPYRFIHWWDGEGGDRSINRLAAEVARECAPSVLMTTDPLGDSETYGQYRGMDILQDWVRVHRAPRDPLSVVYRVERLKAHQRRQGGDIWIGPQLGSATSSGNYAAPADEFEEALRLAAAFGARGFTFWGYNTIRWDSGLDLDTWSRIPKVKGELTSKYAWLLGAKDAQRDFAVFISKANKVYTNRCYCKVDDNYMHFYRALLSAHVPADVVYDDDVLEGALSRYKAVFLPGIEHLTPELEAAVTAYVEAGGRVVRTDAMNPGYLDYEITKGNVSETLEVENYTGGFMYPHQYRFWRHIQAEKMLAAVKDLATVKCDNPDVIINVLEKDGVRRIVLVNDSRTYGAWTDERGYKWAEDEGAEATATVTVGARSATVTIPPAGMEIIDY